MKFNLLQSIPLMDEQKMTCMRIERSLPLYEELAPTLLQEVTLEGYKFEANSLSTKKLAFKLLSPIMEVEEFILTHDKDEKGVLAMMDEGPAQSSQTSPMSLARL